MNPSETKVLAENAPVEKITILGGVATGNMNAQEALMAAGTISNLGSIAAPIAAAATIAGVGFRIARFSVWGIVITATTTPSTTPIAATTATT
mgnify:CR=1 FL=1